MLLSGPRCPSSPAGGGRGSGIRGEQCGLSGPQSVLPGASSQSLRTLGSWAAALSSQSAAASCQDHGYLCVTLKGLAVRFLSEEESKQTLKP